MFTPSLEESENQRPEEDQRSGGYDMEFILKLIWQRVSWKRQKPQRFSFLLIVTAKSVGIRYLFRITIPNAYNPKLRT